MRLPPQRFQLICPLLMHLWSQTQQRTQEGSRRMSRGVLLPGVIQLFLACSVLDLCERPLPSLLVDTLYQVPHSSVHPLTSCLSFRDRSEFHRILGQHQAWYTLLLCAEAILPEEE